MRIRAGAAFLVGALWILVVGGGVAAAQPAAASGRAVAPPSGPAPGPTPAPGAVADPAVQTAEGLVREIYRRVGIEPGVAKDWETVRSLFLPDAVVFMRVTRDSSATMTVGEFLNDFIEFSKRAEVEKKGFAEKILWMKPFVFRNIAQVLVCYEAAVTGSGRPPQRGLDSFQLVRKEGRWWIAGIVNEIPDQEHPLPVEPKE